MTCEWIVEVEALPLGNLYSESWTDCIDKGTRIVTQKNVYTDSRYTFLILDAHGSIWKEKELLTSNIKEIKHAAEISKLLEAV